jgi:hypothetical protein
LAFFFGAKLISKSRVAVETARQSIFANPYKM